MVDLCLDLVELATVAISVSCLRSLPFNFEQLAAEIICVVDQVPHFLVGLPH